MLDIPEIWENRDDYIDEEEEGINMCQALREWMEDERNEGRNEGREEGIRLLIETCQELGASKNVVVKKLIEKYALPDKRARQYIETYWMAEEI